MTSVLRRLREASATSLMCSGLLLKASTARARLQIDVETELGGDDDLVPYGSEGFAHEFFIRKRTIGFGGVEQRDAALDRRAKECDRLGFLVCLTVKVVQSQPKLSAETSRPFFPSFRFCIRSSFEFISEVSEELADGLLA